MLRTSNAFYAKAILSLRNGGRIGTAIIPIINPDNLRIEGWRSSSLHDQGEHILPTMEIRDIIPKGLVVNDVDALTIPEDMVRLEPIIKIGFNLLGKRVVTTNKRRLGKVADFSVNTEYYIQKIYVSQSLLKGLNATPLIIDRSAIVEVTDKKIVIKEAAQKARSGKTAPAQAA